MSCFKVKFLKWIWNFHWSKILLQRCVFLAIFPFDLTKATSTVEKCTQSELYCKFLPRFTSRITFAGVLTSNIQSVAIGFRSVILNKFSLIHWDALWIRIDNDWRNGTSDSITSIDQCWTSTNLGRFNIIQDLLLSIIIDFDVWIFGIIFGFGFSLDL